MTPKEKAKELVDKMWVYALPNSDGSWHNAKQCALIAVEEIISTISSSNDYYDLDEKIEYWQEVKTEIEKL